MTPPIRVLVVDDSAFARKVIRESLESDPAFEVVGIARDGLEALEKIAQLKPDVVTLDLVMPNLDGLGVLRTLPLGIGAPRIVVVSIADEDSALGIAALQAGATDVVHKPTAQATAMLYDLAGDLKAKVKAAALARAAHLLPQGIAAAAAARSPERAAATKRKLLVIGASTGGPQAITKLLRSLPASFPVPIAIVVHMPAGYTAAFAIRLDEESALRVVEASEGLVLTPGMAIIARAGMHLRVDSSGDELRARLDMQPIESAHRPSVDVLFESATPLGAGALALVLTGMGDDGTAGARLLRDAGATVLTEAEESCVVFGMPRSVKEAGLSSAEAPLGELVPLIEKYL